MKFNSITLIIIFLICMILYSCSSISLKENFISSQLQEASGSSQIYGWDYHPIANTGKRDRPSPPSPSPLPKKDKYKCEDNKCYKSKSGKYNTLEDCQKVCNLAPSHLMKFKCEDNKCSLSADGTYTTLEDCQKVCNLTPSHLMKFKCEDNRCSLSADGTYANLQDCIKVCTKPPPAKKYLCLNGDCSENPQGIYSSLAECQQNCKQPKPPTTCSLITGSPPTQDWINKTIMYPDNNQPATKFQYIGNQLCTIDQNGSKLICQDNICPYGMTFDGSKQNCVDCPCNEPGNCIRGINNNPTHKISKPVGLETILTDYSTPGDALVTNDETVFTIFVLDIIENFCKYHKIDIYSLYIHPAISGKPQYRWFSDPKWLYDNFIKLCESNNIKPGVTVYANYHDSGWGPSGESSWSYIGDYIGRVNKNSRIYGSKGIQHIVFDGEACQCGDIDKVRSEFSSGYNKNGETLPTTFIIMSSKGVGAKFTNNNPNDIGLGEVYWNINQSWPCLGNSSQYNNYTPVCKSLTSHNAFTNKEDAYIQYLINSSKQKYSGGDLTKIYEDKTNITVPLFSIEALYQQTNGENDMFCAGLAYWGTDTLPTTADKVCGTFDGFSYWNWDNFEQFMYKYATIFKTKYVGIYAPVFIPKKWMKGGDFSTSKYKAKLSPKFPMNCTDPSNKCKKTCIDSATVECSSDDTCNNYCPGITGYCRTNNTCHFNN